MKADIIPTDSQARAILKRERRAPKDSNRRRNRPTLAAEFFTRPKAEK